MWYFLAVMAALMAALIWNHRRNAAKREAASKERFREMLKAGPATAAPAGEPAAAVASPAVPAAEAAPEPGIAYAARPHLLSPAEKLIYYLLRTGLPDLEVFAKVPLAAVIEAPGMGYDHEQQLRRLARQVLDFVVCDKGMKIMAGVQLAAVGPEAVVAQRIRSECLKSAGIRLVTIDPSALPKRAEVRAFICDGTAVPGASGAPARPL